MLSNKNVPGVERISPESRNGFPVVTQANARDEERTAAARVPVPSEPKLQVLVVDDDQPVRNACVEIAVSLGFAVRSAESVSAARTALSSGTVDLMLLDLRLPGGGGLNLLEEVHAKYPRTIVIVMTAFATVNSAVDAMRIGAGDYLTKPFTLEELSTVLERASVRRTFDVRSRTLREKLRAGATMHAGSARGQGSLIGNSPAMEKMYRILSKVAHTAHPVLILGESGTGKELIARSIHANGPNASKPFIPVDCGSLVPTLIESELFGHVKGAFTGANRTKTGLLAAADNGTVFLDEIGELPLDLQAKLLRALQEKEVRPVGATHSVPIAARIVAATNRDLAAMVENGRFRADLYFRLNVVNIRVPALRERKEDVPLLASHFLDRLRRENGVAYTFANDAMQLLIDYEWPGNVRELEHTVERACALSSGPLLHAGDFTTQMQDYRLHFGAGQMPRGMQANGAGEDGGVVVSIAEMEKKAILGTIRQLKGDKLMAAKLLGIGKTTLYRKLKEYGLGDDESLA